jgi:sugar lactone lactonase YvrE
MARSTTNEPNEGKAMRRRLETILSACAAALCIAAAVPAAGADHDLVPERHAAQRFATLPDGVRFPEGLAANPANGDLYVGTFDTAGTRPNRLLRLARNGRLVAQRDFGGTPLLGLAFDAARGMVYVANFGASAIQRVAADLSGPIVTVATIPGIGAPPARTVANPDGSADTILFGSSGFPAPNGLAFDDQGRLYVSDSFQGAVWRIDDAAACSPCIASLLVQDPLLATAGHPPFGANGIAFNADRSALFIANTGDDRILRLDMATRTIGVFAESIDGADGLAFDAQGRLWVAANQADEIVALNERGRVVARLGEFQGIRRDGSPDGLLFPASVAIVGDELFVTNLALPLTPAVGDEPEEDVTRFTVSRLKAPKR